MTYAYQTRSTKKHRFTCQLNNNSFEISQCNATGRPMLGNLSGADLRALHVFVTVAECGGFSPAQVVLNVSQPTISVQIMNLERRLGFRLCERGRTGFRLTRRGGAVLDQAKTLFGSVKEFRSEVNSLAGRLMGELHAGFIDTVISNEQAKMSQAIAGFRNRNQEVALSLTVGSPVELERAVIDERMHLAIGYFGRRLEFLHYEPLFRERQEVYCARGHVLFDRSPDGATQADLERADWVARGYPLGEDLRSYAPPRTSATASHMEAIAMLILSGHHIGYLPDHYARPWVAANLMRPVLPAKLAYEVSFDLVTRRGRRQSNVLKAFIQDMKAAHSVA